LFPQVESFRIKTAPRCDFKLAGVAHRDLDTLLFLLEKKTKLFVFLWAEKAEFVLAMDFAKKPGSRDKKPEKGTRRYGTGHNHVKKQNTLFCFDRKGEITESYNLNKVREISIWVPPTLAWEWGRDQIRKVHFLFF
jgi:hypothetical protein